MAWMASQKQPRMRREPSACCDNFTPGAEGLQFYDQMDMFNGTLERYSWKLAGKRELLIPYNSPRSVAGADKGDYDVLLSVPDIFVATAGNPRYAVRFANADNASLGQVWDATGARFKAGTTLRVN